MKSKLLILFLLFLSMSLVSIAQCNMTPDSSGLFVFSGSQKVKVKSAKKMTAMIRAWANKKLESPMMVFSVFPEEEGAVTFKGVMHVPSMKSLNDVSFVARIECEKRRYVFRISKFRFEDINISLEEWYEKNSPREDERSQKNMSMVCRGIDSQVGLMLANLTENLNH